MRKRQVPSCRRRRLDQLPLNLQSETKPKVLIWHVVPVRQPAWPVLNLASLEAGSAIYFGSLCAIFLLSLVRFGY